MAATFRGKVVPWAVGTGANSAAKREWFDRIGGYDERLGVGSSGKAAEDMDLFYRLLRAGATIQYQPDALVYHERQTRAQRLSSRWSYGYGIGAFSGIWLRRGDRFAWHVLGYWLFLQCRGLAQSLMRGQRFLAYQRVLSLRGTVRGVLYGLRTG
jgi:GT2 family glycosyltransferase